MAEDLKGKIQTVLGCMDPSQLGRTLTHEHLWIDASPLGVPTCPPFLPNLNSLPFNMDNLGFIRQFPYSHTPNLTLHGEEQHVMEELKFYRQHGGSSMVECTTVGISNNIGMLKTMAEKTGVNIIAGAGYYVDSSLPSEVHSATQEQLVSTMVQDVTQGPAGTGIRCGVIGEIGTSWPITATEKKVLVATAAAQTQLGCPVIIHPGRNRAAPAEVIRILAEAGGDIGRTVMSHLDRSIYDKGELSEFAALGSYLEWDLFGIEVSYYQQVSDVDMPSDAQRIQMVKHVLEEGYEDRVVIAHDIHTKHRLMHYGGHGYSHILLNVVPMMLARGVSQEQTNIMNGSNTDTDPDNLYGNPYDHLYAYDYGDLFDDFYSTLGQEEDGTDTQPQDRPASLSFRAALGVVYVLIIVICGVGNLVFLVVIGRYKKARTKTNLLIANLAFSDFVVAVLCVPFSLDYYVIHDRAWRYGGEMCAVVNYVKTVSLHVSTNALVVIGVDRYITIVRPRWRRVGKTGAMLVSAGVWLLSILIAVPSAKFSLVRPNLRRHHQGYSFCGVVWNARHLTVYKGYYGSMLAFQFVLPVVVMAVCSLPVIWKVFHRELPGILTDAIREKVQRSKRKTLRLVLILALFVLCWAPYYVYAALRDFHHVLTLTDLNTNIFYAVEAAAMGNSVINTCVYVAFNKNVTNFVRMLAKDCRGLHQTTESNTQQIMLPSDGEEEEYDNITLLSYIGRSESFRQIFDRCQETTL
ncbi:PREDICTED: uncharacterized protein LOC109463505 [Branchiostoma belcheri]|uniref:N-acetyltaurine hydrolase n=1 Tax=Branchiostoma belcheri TaxID=7741 RepID=A0A6P4XUY0_BRABE|nr:PREDICTED: uncharacterized protein LOC109463505 [Branchiostoma belcheri]